MTTTLNFKLGF